MAEIAALRIDCSNLSSTVTGTRLSRSAQLPTTCLRVGLSIVSKSSRHLRPFGSLRSAVSCGRAPPEALSTCVVSIETWR